MEINKLNELQVKNAKAGTQEYRLSDGDGLYFVVTLSGGKLWRWSYEFNSKANRRSLATCRDFKHGTQTSSTPLPHSLGDNCSCDTYNCAVS